MATIPSYDVAIVGMGTMGSFTAMELLNRGCTVIGFDRFSPPHERGSHGGQTRVFRLAYPEGSGYVPLAQQAGALWDRLNDQFPVKLLHRSGMLYMGVEGESFLDGISESARTNALPLVTRQGWEIRRDFPAFQVPDSFTGLLDPAAGWIDVDASITQAHAFCHSEGAAIHLACPIVEWSTKEHFIQLKTQRDEFRAIRLIVCAGAWTGGLLADLGLPITIRRKILTWFHPLRPELFEEGRIPVFTFPENSTYGFPAQHGNGVKLAEHLGGIDLSSPDESEYSPNDSDIGTIQVTASKYMPDLIGPPPGDPTRLLRTSSCFYSVTPDENFIVDFHPHHPGVVLAAGFSGHGFKFAPLIAIALADLALNGSTTLPIDFWRLERVSVNSSGFDLDQ